ncbi:MAG TPA: VanZ family protein [Marmoricola sp.]|nr:VanZ family protein [Marmoricola sp.]
MSAERGSRRLLLVCLAAYALFLAWTVFWPTGRIAGSVVLHADDAALTLGVPARIIDPSRMEFALNAAMVAPLVVLAVLLWPRWGWERWTAYAFVASSAVELTQGLFLPMRSAQYVDVVANTCGAGLGAVLGRLLLAVRSRAVAEPAAEPAEE